MKTLFSVSTISDDFKSDYPIARDCIGDILDYLHGDDLENKICAIYGFLGTGKTTLLKQAIEQLGSEQKVQTIYIECKSGSNFEDIIDYVEDKFSDGYKYFFIDEITNAENFQQLATIMSDKWVERYKAKIVVTGTDSLGLSLVRQGTMYDRIKGIKTTYISFGEYLRLVGVTTITDFIRVGSVLNKDVLGTEEKNKKYVNDSVVKNIISSCKKNEGFRRYPPSPTEVYSEDVIKSGIEIIINKYIQSIAERVSDLQISSDFVSGLIADSTAFNVKAILVIYELLKDIDVFFDVPVYRLCENRLFDRETVFVSHPGMYYASLKSLTNEQSATRKLIENVVISDMYHLLGRNSGRWHVSKLTIAKDNQRFDVGVLVMDKTNNDVFVFEIDCSKENTSNQNKYLEDEGLNKYIEANLGFIKSRIVLCNGVMDCTTVIPRIPVELFLDKLYMNSKSQAFEMNRMLSKVLIDEQD